MSQSLRFSAPVPLHDAVRVETLRSYAILDTPPERAYDDVTVLASFICETPFATITLVDSDRQWFKSEVGLGTNQTGRSDGFCACAILQPETMIVEDTLVDPRFCDNPFVLGAPRIRFYAGAPLIAPNGHVLGTVCVFDTRPRILNPAQLNALEALARQVMAQLELRLKLIESEQAAIAIKTTEKLAAVGRLASSIAHEINNPLEALTNLLYLVKQDTTLSPVSRQYLETADKELAHISQVASQTLRFHQQSTRAATVQPSSLIEEALNFYSTRLRNYDIRVSCQYQPQIELTCFEGDIRQVLNNLIGNAADAMRHGGVLTIRTSLATRWSTGESGVRITVADTGTGMKLEVKARIFEAFFTTKDIHGTGLGLWVSNRIVKQHQGSLRVYSSPHPSHSGTVFTLWLPLLLAESARALRHSGTVS
jgi:signal transduction histidine kinase